MAVNEERYRGMGEVGGCFVRIRPFVNERDLRALGALRTLCQEIDAAFDSFYETLAGDDPALPEGEQRHAA